MDGLPARGLPEDLLMQLQQLQQQQHQQLQQQQQTIDTLTAMMGRMLDLSNQPLPSPTWGGLHPDNVDDSTDDTSAQQFEAGPFAPEHEATGNDVYNSSLDEYPEDDFVSSELDDYGSDDKEEEDAVDEEEVEDNEESWGELQDEDYDSEEGSDEGPYEGSHGYNYESEE